MGIVTNILPGIREVRAPLLAGYLWLLFAWLAFVSDVETSPAEHQMVDDVVELAEAAGSVAIGIAVSTLAYLVGSLSQGISWIATRWVTPSLFRQLRHTAEVALGKAYREVAEQYTARGLRLDGELLRKVLDRCGFKGFEDLTQAVTIEATQPAALLGNDAYLREIDRFRTEADLRLAVIPPLAALTVLLTVDISALWALTFLALGLLYVQGIARYQDSLLRTMRLVILQAVRLASVERFKAEAEFTLNEHGPAKE